MTDETFTHERLTFRRTAPLLLEAQGLPWPWTCTLRRDETSRRFTVAIWSGRAWHYGNPDRTILSAAEEAIAILQGCGVITVPGIRDTGEIAEFTDSNAKADFRAVVQTVKDLAASVARLEAAVASLDAHVATLGLFLSSPTVTVKTEAGLDLTYHHVLADR